MSVRFTCPNVPRCAIGTTFLLLIAAAIEAPIAYLQLGNTGLVVLGAAVLTMVAAITLSKFAEWYFVGPANAFARQVATMILRMLIPLSFVLTVILWEHPNVPTWSALYIAPLYFVVLIAETIAATRRIQSSASRSAVERRS